MKGLLVALVALAFGSAAVFSAEWSGVFTSLEHSVLHVMVAKAGRDVGTCSAVVLNTSNDTVVTAAHCISDEAAYSYTVDGRAAKLLKLSRDRDLAVLKTRLRRGVVSLPLAPRAPTAGTAVAVLGFPFEAASLTIQIGIVANAQADAGGKAWINADLLPGDSGGAIVDLSGHLVGLTSGYLSQGAAHIGCAVPLETIRDFVDEYLQ